jgi:hypothetical protein
MQKYLLMTQPALHRWISGCLHGFAANGSDYDRQKGLTGLKLLLDPLG